MATKTKATKTTKTEVKPEESEFFKEGNRVQWFQPDGPRIGVIEKLFDKVCWIRLAGAENVGGEIIKGVPLLEIEAYSSEPGPIEEAIAALETAPPTPGEEPEETEAKCQGWQVGDKVGFFEGETWIEGVISDLEDVKEGTVWVDSGDALHPDVPISDLTLLGDESASAGTLEKEVIEDKSESEDFGLFWLPIAAIEEHEDFQPRGNAWQSTDKGISIDVVTQYAEWLEYSEPPAIEVWQGQIGDAEGWWLLSGHHRIRALKKAGRDQVQCFQKATSYEDAIYRAAISNAGGGDRTRQIYKMSRNEWGEACKQFLRVCDRLSEEAIQEFLNEAVAITGTKTWNKLNDSAISAVFGISRGSVQNYKKQIELEKAAAQFPKGTRVLLTNYTELQLLGDRKYRLGVVNNFDSNNGLHIIFDYARCPSGYHLPKDLVKVDDPAYEKPTKFKVGDRLWHQDNGFGIVVSIEAVPSVRCLKGVSDENPLIFWESGRHSANGLYKIDYEGHTKSVPSVDERLLRLAEYIAVDLKDEPEESFLKINAVELHRYLSGLPMDEPTSTTQEAQGKRKELLGRSQPAGGGGSNGSELPDQSTTNGKHPEDPGTTAVGVLERPAEAGNLERAKLEARLSAARNAIANVKLDLEVLPDDDIKEVLKAAKAELTRRHKPAQEGDPEKRHLEAC